MRTLIHRSDTRGYAQHGWLESYHTFSFASYYDPQRIQFGALRVLNDDTVAAGQGFGKHPHKNMEIISIPLEGDLAHQDSMGNVKIIKEGELQVMSAGRGIYHSEYNRHDDRPVKFLQIWVIPDKQNVAPRYDQISLNQWAVPDRFYQIVSPYKHDQGVWIHQQAWFSLADLHAGKQARYSLKGAAHGVYLFVLEGQVNVGDETLYRRDGLGTWDVDKIMVEATKTSRLLLIEVPLSAG